ncbi:deoxyribodipyrimidine photo-lyase [Salinispira pacifica]|uniref:Deoxyribodipyrimidine photo-lyase n=1 Tax=Salinispira pacifica TaxID=1307761 RepID=V5WJS2_9SPIO|nr:deoxyribodipyrimidine photo-lyase [Salinispira pacifica]AHC15834.1 Deoxyribodipyrimidine photolyase, type II [Salinispira pacifica]
MNIPPFQARIEDFPPEGQKDSGSSIVYWMQSAQRFEDNMALNYAAAEAERNNLPFHIIFCLDTSYPDASARHFWFMIQGLQEIAAECRKTSVNFSVLPGSPPEVFSREDLHRHLGGIRLLVTERSYLRHLRLWRKDVAAQINSRGGRFIQLDSEVLVPHNLVSSKKEYAAATIRKKITSQWLPYLRGERHERQFYMGPVSGYLSETREKTESEIPLSLNNEELIQLTSYDDFTALLTRRGMHAPSPVPAPVDTFRGGSNAAHERLERFLNEDFPRYGEIRNDPGNPVQSDLSPYLHFGMISVLRIAWSTVEAAEDLRQYPKRNSEAVPDESLEAFLEELIVRRELAKNFVRFESRYDSYEGIPEWAAKSLEEHAGDPREHLYSLKELEEGRTYDPYWNACQLEMVKTGKMHGYMRMYWGKKVLEWSKSPREAFEHLLYLNNRWELDGRDENGYTGVSWCFGTHDRGWKERPIFGKIRYMNDKGLERKFDIKSYAQKWLD